MLPQLASGSRMPSPRKDSDASARMKPGMESVADTIANVRVVGTMWRTIIMLFETPNARAASTYSRSLTERTMPRITRAMLANPISDKMQIISR